MILIALLAVVAFADWNPDDPIFGCSPPEKAKHKFTDDLQVICGKPCGGEFTPEGAFVDNWGFCNLDKECVKADDFVDLCKTDFRTVDIEDQFTGNPRRYTVRLPEDYAPEEKKYALLFAIHGFTWNMQAKMAFKFNEDLIVVFPDGTASDKIKNNWNAGVCCDVDNSEKDDVKYMEAVLDKVIEEESVDEERIYIVGFSNGGYMTQRMMCESDRFTKGMPVVSSLSMFKVNEACFGDEKAHDFYGAEVPTFDPERCTLEVVKSSDNFFECKFSEHKRPMRFLNGMSDNIMDPLGAIHGALNPRTEGELSWIAPTDLMMQFWAEQAGCKFSDFVKKRTKGQDFCYVNSKCETEMSFCWGPKGDHFGFGYAYDTVESIEDFLCADGGCTPTKLVCDEATD